jgi:hypothetical protein
MGKRLNLVNLIWVSEEGKTTMTVTMTAFQEKYIKLCILAWRGLNPSLYAFRVPSVWPESRCVAMSEKSTPP